MYANYFGLRRIARILGWFIFVPMPRLCGTGNGRDDLLLVTARCTRVGLKEDSPIGLSAQDCTGGLSPVREHGGVRYAATSVARLRPACFK